MWPVGCSARTPIAEAPRSKLWVSVGCTRSYNCVRTALGIVKSQRVTQATRPSFPAQSLHGGYGNAPHGVAMDPMMAAGAGYVPQHGAANGHAGGFKLFVGMIPYSTGEVELQSVFSHFGSLMEVFMMKEKDGRSKGCAFIRFNSMAAADRACTALNGSMSLPGAVRALVVKYADAPEPRNSRSASASGAGCFLSDQSSHSPLMGAAMGYPMPPMPTLADAQYMHGHGGLSGSPTGSMDSPMMGGMAMVPNIAMIPPGGISPVMQAHYGSPTMDGMGNIIHPGGATYAMHSSAQQMQMQPVQMQQMQQMHMHMQMQQMQMQGWPHPMMMEHQSSFGSVDAVPQAALHPSGHPMMAQAQQPILFHPVPIRHIPTHHVSNPVFRLVSY